MRKEYHATPIAIRLLHRKSQFLAALAARCGQRRMAIARKTRWAARHPRAYGACPHRGG